MVRLDLKMSSRCRRSATFITKNTAFPKPGTVSSNVYRPRTRNASQWAKQIQRRQQTMLHWVPQYNASTESEVKLVHYETY